MALPILAEQRLTLETCCACGIEFAMPNDFNRRMREKHEWFYCPAGHRQHYSQETEVERLQKEAEQLRRRLEFARNDAESARRHANMERRRVSAARGQTTKLKNRIAKGRCPCCGKHFADLKEHMDNRHPEFTNP